MGMYDYLNGEQVKCFYRIIHYKDGENSPWEFSHSGGQLRGYIDGSELPLKTFHYKYPSNFLILDENERVLHTIKNSRLFSTQSLSDIASIEESLLKNVYSYYGLSLNINSINELKEYPAKVSEKIYTIRDMQNKYKPSSSKLIKSFRLMDENAKDLESIVFLLEDEDYINLNSLLDFLDLGFNLHFDSPIKSKIIIKSLLDNEKTSQNTIDFIKNKANELFYRFSDRLECEEEELNKILKPYLNSFNERWIKDNNFKIEEKIGGYISVINELDELKKDSPEYFNDKEKESYEVSLKELKKLIKEYGIDSYIEWLNPSNKELEIINDILNRL